VSFYDIALGLPLYVISIVTTKIKHLMLEYMILCKVDVILNIA